MNTRVRPLEQKVVSSRRFIPGVNEDSAFNHILLPPIDGLNGQAFIRHRNAMCRKESLMVASALHSSQHGFQITRYHPSAGAGCFGEPHRFERSQASGNVVPPYAGKVP